MLADAEDKQFDVIVAEDIDRLARGEGDAPKLRQRLEFHDVEIHTCTDGHITKLHAGLKGLMSSLFLDNLIAHTKRGWLGSSATDATRAVEPTDTGPSSGVRASWRSMKRRPPSSAAFSTATSTDKHRGRLPVISIAMAFHRRAGVQRGAHRRSMAIRSAATAFYRTNFMLALSPGTRSRWFAIRRRDAG